MDVVEDYARKCIECYPLLGCLSSKDHNCDLSSKYWIPRHHKNPYRQRHIAGSAKCSTKPLSKLLYTKLSKMVSCPITTLVTPVVVLIQY